ncbi:unnamed protein product, partial [Prorocentrum cordatum]
ERPCVSVRDADAVDIRAEVRGGALGLRGAVRAPGGPRGRRGPPRGLCERVPGPPRPRAARPRRGGGGRGGEGARPGGRRCLPGAAAEVPVQRVARGRQHVPLRDGLSPEPLVPPQRQVLVPRGAPVDVRAARSVGAGEELLPSYLHEEKLALPLAERRRALAASWGFACGCARCAEEQEAAEAEAAADEAAAAARGSGERLRG